FGGGGKQGIELLEAVAVGFVGVLYHQHQLVAGQQLLGGIVAIGVGQGKVGDDGARFLGVEQRHGLVLPSRIGRKLVKFLGFTVAGEGVAVLGRLGRLHQLADVITYFIR
nr:hypothetical protein [Tanacetum cinerariifolium]